MMVQTPRMHSKSPEQLLSKMQVEPSEPSPMVTLAQIPITQCRSPEQSAEAAQDVPYEPVRIFSRSPEL
jgi:hypothetical protein